MKKTLILFILFLLCLPLLNATEISPGNVSGTWSSANSPYNINGDITIPQNTTLTIEPNVIINFTGHFKLNVEGRLLAEGTNGNSIIFQTSDNNIKWAGIRIENLNSTAQDSTKFDYCFFKNGEASGDNPDTRGGAIYINNSNQVSIKNSIFQENTAEGAGGAIYIEDSDITLSNCNFLSNSTVGSGGAIFIKTSNPSISDCSIQENESSFEGAGIYAFNSDFTLSKTTIAYNTSQNMGGGIAIYYDSNVTFEKCTIAYNSAYQGGSGIAVLYNSDTTINNSIVYFNAVNQIYVVASANAIANYSDIQNASENNDYWTEFCINEDPLFVSPTDFHLTWENNVKSPCIDTGNPNITDLDGTIVDMGAYYFPQTGIQGHVTISPDNGNITEVIIGLANNSGESPFITTNPSEDGDFRFDVSPGTYYITASLEGYSSYGPEPVTVDFGLVAIVPDFTLQTAPMGYVTGKVALEALGTIEEVIISSGNYETNPYYDPAEEAYVYSLELPPGLHNVKASLDGYQDSTYTDVRVYSNIATENIDYTLQLIRFEGTIEGNITLKSGTGNVEDVVISVDGETATVHPDASGNYSIDVAQGYKTVRASLDGYADVSLENIVVVQEMTTPNINMILLPWEVIDGTPFSMVNLTTVSYANGSFFTGEGSNQVAAFDSNGQCRGVATWIDGNYPGWNDTNINPSYHYDLPGYWYLTIVSDNNSGELITIKAYDSENDTVYVCTEQIEFSDDGEPEYPDLNRPNLIIDDENISQEIDFIENWNWVSFNVHIDSMDIDTFIDLDNYPEFRQFKMQTQTATNFGSAPWIGDLETVSSQFGYLVDMTSSLNDFTVPGDLNINTLVNPIELGQNYNWVSYYPTSPLSIEEAMASIEDNVYLVKSQTQSAIYDNGWVGDLTTLYPGKAYKIKMNDVDYLVYPDIATSTREYKSNENQTEFQTASGFMGNMILISKIYNEENIEISDSQNEVYFFDNNGICRSSGSYQNGLWYFTIVGNDNGENLTMKILDKSSRKLASTHYSLQYKEDDIIGSLKNPKEIKIKNSSMNNIQTVILNQNHPNPFNPQTTFSYYLSQPQKVTFEIYNVLGQKVTTLVNKKQESGNHSIVWNAEKQSSGVYFYKIKTEDSEITKKCILLK